MLLKPEKLQGWTNMHISVTFKIQNGFQKTEKLSDMKFIILF